MKNNTSFTLISAVLGVVLVFSAGYANEQVPDRTAMNSKVYGQHTKSLVTFTHKKHNVDYKIACAECHHVYKDGKSIWEEGDKVEKCGVCHSKDKPSREERKELSGAEKIKGYHYEAIHENCKGCHKDLKREGKPTGPIACSKCHPKER